MALRRKEHRVNIRSTHQLLPHHHPTSLSPTILDSFAPLEHNHSHIRQSPLNRSHLGEKDISSFKGIERSGMHSSLNMSVSPKARTKLPPVVKKMQPSEVKMPCTRHNSEAIKFVDVAEGKFEGLCDVCMVSSEFMGKSMKLERFVDLYEKKRKALIKSQEELKELESQIAKIHKDIHRVNVMTAPLLRELDEMEKKAVREVERMFKKIKAKFLKFNPFNDTRDLIRQKLEGSQSVIDKVEEGTKDSFVALKKVSLNETKILSENKALVNDLVHKIQTSTTSDPLQEKDFGVLVFQYQRFLERMEESCRILLQGVKLKS